MGKRVTINMTEAVQRDRYIANVGHDPPAPLQTPDWQYSNGTLNGRGKDWLHAFTRGAKPWKEELSPLERVRKASAARRRAESEFKRAVQAAVETEPVAGVAEAAGLTRQRIYQLAS